MVVDIPVLLKRASSSLESGSPEWLHQLQGHLPKVVPLDLDAAEHGQEISINGGVVRWQGIPLSSCSAVLLAQPQFSWPQTNTYLQSPSSGENEEERTLRAEEERERRALTISALKVTASQAKLSNPPATWHAAAAPTNALWQAQASGLRVHPWEIGTANPSQNSDLEFDLVGSVRERICAPNAPGDAVLRYRQDPDQDERQGPVFQILLVDGRPVAGQHFANLPTWIATKREDQQANPQTEPVGMEWLDCSSNKNETDFLASAELGSAALKAVGAYWGLTTVGLGRGASSPRLLHVDLGPDLEKWNTGSQGVFSHALAEHLKRLSESDGQG